MVLVNRDVLVLKGKQPLVVWINSHDKANPVDLSQLQEDCNAYLLPECNGRDAAMYEVKCNYDVFFERELEAWYVDESLWPQDRSFTMFKKWFEIEYHSMVMDVLDSPIQKSPY